MQMKVQKRNGDIVPVLFDKVVSRIAKLCGGLDVQADKVAQKVFMSMYDGIKTSEIDEVSAEIAVHMQTESPDYEILATRIVVSNMHKTSPKTFSDCALVLHTKGILSDTFMKCLALELDTVIEPTRDYSFGYFGLKTLQRGYLLPGETPQYMFMRVAIGIHGDDLNHVKETYDLMSRKFFTHATPTLFNAGTNRPQLSSCFLIATKEDSIEGIYDTLKECAQISKWSGGIGLHISNVRSNGTAIKGTNGVADGIVPMLRVFNNTARYVNQGGGKRKGSFAVYLEPWHADVLEFLELRLNQGDEEARCRDLFTALWIPDLFMQKVTEDGDWYLMCPNESPGLQDVYGEEFNELYRLYVAQGRYKRVIKARQIWDAMLKSQIETGTPYMGYKDSVNAKSNQKNIGVIKSSNLCMEIVEVSTPEETAVCNLASVCLPSFVWPNGHFDLTKLHAVVRVMTRNLNRIIDTNYYPVETARRSNLKHRPIGIGVQGLADVFMMMGLPFDSEKARARHRLIFETIYHAALTESCTLAQEEGVYETYHGSPASQGILQPDMWKTETPDLVWKWTQLRQDIATHGLRNSLLIAPMPTASTSQIMGNNECFEPYTTNLYLRRTLAGEFVVVNKHLVNDLRSIGLWNKEIKDSIIRDGGSIQNLTGVPDSLKAIYRTVWEIPMKSLIDMSAERAPYIDQSQSLNLFVENPTLAKLSSMHMYAWKKGLKTGMYYLRTRAKAKPQQVTIAEEVLACRRDNPDGCVMCSS
jgi:ribonucleoside-diphosphate reductase alpha chain/ribonucleoside-diphosphate reductase subunit M1